MTCNTRHMVLALLFILVSFLQIAQTSQADDTLQLVIETEILAPDPQPGMKSRHVVQVDYGASEVRDAYQTGVTDFFGTDLTSIRDSFRIEGAEFKDGSASFTVKGETASGVGVIPNINYSFDVELESSGKYKLSGCHDGYPAYRVIIEGKEVYSFTHKRMQLIKLFGSCDIAVNK